jgi:hypothetical protein
LLARVLPVTSTGALSSSCRDLQGSNTLVFVTEDDGGQSLGDREHQELGECAQPKEVCLSLPVHIAARSAVQPVQPTMTLLDHWR